MKIGEVKEKAKTLGIKASNVKKTEIIRSIQKAEGNTPCFGTSKGQCSQAGCCFIDDCLRIKL